MRNAAIIPLLPAVLAVVAVVAALSPCAHAQDADTFAFSGSTFDGQGTLQRLSPVVSPTNAWYAGLGLAYANDPLVFYGSDGSETSVVSDQLSTHLQGGYTFGGHARLDLDVPIYPSVKVSGSGQFAMGDVRLGALVPLLKFQGDGVGLGVQPYALLPTASADVFVGKGGFSGGLLASLGGQHGRLGWVVDAGTELAPAATIGDTTTGTTFDAGLGVNYAALTVLRIGVELDQTFSLAKSVQAAGSPLEGHLYGTYGSCSGLFATLGGGASLIRGVGSPDFRVLAALGFRKADCDVPDVDSDGDGLLDGDDACPNSPEDFDGYQDQDGCPDDNDSDGVADVDDACPAVAGLPALAGCPDGDGDGVTDAEDACPTEPGPANAGGCPDRDGDRVPDARDQCPDEAADPRSDPAQSDGCPTRVVVAKNEIIILDKVFFDNDKASIKPASRQLLMDVAKVITDHPALGKIQVQGHTDSVGDAPYNLDLSSRRADAVRAFLIDQGKVAQARLVAKGFGETVPLVVGDTPEANAKNRRVEFKILK